MKLIKRRDFTLWMAGAGGLIAVGGGDRWLRERLQKLHNEIENSPNTEFLSFSAASLCHSDKQRGLKAVVSLLGLEDLGGKTHFHVFFFSPEGELLRLESSRLGQLENSLFSPPDELWQSVLVAIETPKGNLLPLHPESSVIIHHRSDRGEDGHHMGHWTPGQGNLGYLPLSGTADLLIAGANLSDRNLKGDLIIQDRMGRTILHDKSYEFPAYSTRYFYVGSNVFQAPNAKSLPIPKGTDAYLVEFTDPDRGTITWNAWRQSEKSFTAFHGVHTGSGNEVQDINTLEAFNQSGPEFMARHWLYPVDLVPFERLPNGTPARAEFFLPNFSNNEARPRVYLVNNTGQIRGQLKQIKSVPPGGSLIVKVPEDFEIKGELGDYGYALAHFGVKSPPQSLGKVLSLSHGGKSAFMQHFRPLEISRISELGPIAKKLNQNLLTDYFTATPTDSARQLLIRNYGNNLCTDAQLSHVNTSGKVTTLHLPEIPGGASICVNLEDLKIPAETRGLRLTSMDSALKISMIQQSANYGMTMSHGTHRIKLLKSLDALNLPILKRIGDRSDA